MVQSCKIVFIGSGRLATQLACALHAVGYSILQVYSRTETSAKELSDKLDCGYTTQADCITDQGDLYICALKDSVITEVLDQARKSLKGKVLVHTAGSLPMTLLEKYTVRCGVIYPMQTFSKEKKVDFTKVPFLLEGADDEVYSMLKETVSSLSQKLYQVSSEDRKKIHLAAVFACNFANHSYALADELLKKCGVPFDVLLPLIDETTEKVHTMEPAKAQSGPAVRYDQNVMEMHKMMLQDQPMMQQIYELMSSSIHQLAERQK